ncbi:MAG: hypothetical protein KGH57_00610 [Candidatus Micrarchaeota archaeon]|nr:hypothetical protein [Candidatus Micrarchaeota archaeon]
MIKMTANDKLLLFALAALVAAMATPAVGAQSPCATQPGGCITSYAVFQQWLPIVMLAVLVSITVVSAYYMLGVLLNNSRIKSRAIGELGQASGTGIVVIAIISVFVFFGSGIFMQVPGLTPTNLNTICGQLGGSQVILLNSGGTFSSGQPTPTNQVCSEVTKLQSGVPSLTDSIDYGLFTSYIVVANLTNQAVNNLNSLYEFEGWIGFLYKFTAETQVCSPGLPPPPFCPFGDAGEGIKFSYQPMAGFDALRGTITQPTEVQGALTFYVFFLEFVVTILILYLWPWLLAAGIILRASFFTRRAGGLLIALMLAWLLVFPSMIALEYSAFQNIGSGLQPIGTTSIPALPLFGKSPTGSLYVYGAPQVGGYVPATQDQNAVSCPPTDWAYEEVCGYSQTTPSGSTTPGGLPVCTATPSSTCASSGYVPGAYIPGSNCPATEPYAYEATCGDPSSFTGQCSSQQLPSCQQLYGSLEFGSVKPEPISINFYVFPKVADVLSFYSCLPDSVVNDEGAFASWYLVPAYSLITGIGGGLQQSVPTTPAVGPGGSLNCNQYNGIASAMAIANLYGIIAVTAYLVPMLNLIIIISAAVGLSGLMGGDTDIIGLSKLL